VSSARALVALAGVHRGITERSRTTLESGRSSDVTVDA
jgi:hypothetical protein